ncbi:MAG: hypothetical protein IKV10_03670 [Alphaproteobacteria bacterium]|nr:hypothetical protein [Alphaproteobacteria bacterium]
MELGKKYFAVDLKQPIATAITEGVCHQFTINNAGWISVALVPTTGNVVLAKVKSCFETRAEAEMFYENNHKRQTEIEAIAKEANDKIEAIREMIFGKPEFPEMAVGYVAPKEESKPEEPKAEGE